jgi:GTP-binding protein
MAHFAEEMADEGEDEDIEYVDADDVEDLDDFEYEEEWEDEK